MKALAKRNMNHVANRPLSKVMVDAKDVALSKSREQNPIEILRRRQITPKGLLDNHPGTLCAAGFRQMLDHRSKQRAAEWPDNAPDAEPPSSFAKRVEGCAVCVIAIDITEQAAQLFESCGIKPSVFLQAIFSPSAKLFEVPTRFRDADHRDIEVTAFDHRLQRGEDFLVGEIAGRTEEDQCV